MMKYDLSIIAFLTINGDTVYFQFHSNNRIFYICVYIRSVNVLCQVIANVAKYSINYFRQSCGENAVISLLGASHAGN